MSKVVAPTPGRIVHVWDDVDGGWCPAMVLADATSEAFTARVFAVGNYSWEVRCQVSGDPAWRWPPRPGTPEAV